MKLIKFCLALILILCVASPAPTAANTAAAPHCFGASCTGKDPQVYGCWKDAVTIEVSPQPGTAAAGWQEVVEMRYSSNCAARWSRVTSRLQPSQIKYTSAYLPGYPASRVTRYGVGGKQVYSRMVWAVNPSGSACGNSIWKADPSYHPTHCTP